MEPILDRYLFLSIKARPEPTDCQKLDINCTLVSKCDHSLISEYRTVIVSKITTPLSALADEMTKIIDNPAPFKGSLEGTLKPFENWCREQSVAHTNTIIFRDITN